jgi:hypothetical protein
MIAAGKNLLSAYEAIHSDTNINGEIADTHWREYVELRPKVYESFVNSILRAQVIVTDMELQIDGSLTPVIPPKDLKKCRIEIFRIDLTAYRNNLLEKDDLHVGAFNVMHIVRLPESIPGERALGNDILWVTCDDISILRIVRGLSMVVLTGNPGIGKSWWQWQYLLYSLRPDVYWILIDGLCDGGGISREMVALLRRDVKPEIRNKELPPNCWGQNVPPSVIIRYDAGKERALVFFLSKPISSVHVLKKLSNPDAIVDLLDRPNTVLLYEPGRNRNCAVPYEALVNISIIATVSPDERRYKEFGKNGGVREYLPCPSKAEIIAIAAFMRPCVHRSGSDLFSVENIIARIDDIGPFPRYVLACNAQLLVDVAANRQAAVHQLETDSAALQRFAKLDTIEVQSRDNTAPVSHWLLCYDAVRDHELPYSAASAYLVVSSTTTLKLARDIRDKVHFETKIKALIALHTSGKYLNIGLEREWLEDVFAVHAGAGLKWRMYDSSQKDRKSFELTLQGVVAGKLVKVNEMQDRTLYYRMEDQFPFMDGVWKSGGSVFAFQATTSKKHPKTLETFKKALDLLGIDESMLQTKKFHMFYVVMPRCFDEWNGKTIPPSFFWKEVLKSKAEIDEYSRHIQFALLCPPGDFGRQFK